MLEGALEMEVAQYLTFRECRERLGPVSKMVGATSEKVAWRRLRDVWTPPGEPPQLEGGRRATLREARAAVARVAFLKKGAVLGADAASVAKRAWRECRSCGEGAGWAIGPRVASSARGDRVLVVDGGEGRMFAREASGLRQLGPAAKLSTGVKTHDLAALGDGWLAAGEDGRVRHFDAELRSETEVCARTAPAWGLATTCGLDTLEFACATPFVSAVGGHRAAVVFDVRCARRVRGGVQCELQVGGDGTFARAVALKPPWLVAVGTTTGLAAVFDVRRQQRPVAQYRHRETSWKSSEVRALAWTRHGLVTGSYDGRLRLWGDDHQRGLGPPAHRGVSDARLLAAHGSRAVETVAVVDDVVVSVDWCGVLAFAELDPDSHSYLGAYLDGDCGSARGTGRGVPPGGGFAPGTPDARPAFAAAPGATALGGQDLSFDLRPLKSHGLLQYIPDADEPAVSSLAVAGSSSGCPPLLVLGHRGQAAGPCSSSSLSGGGAPTNNLFSYVPLPFAAGLEDDDDDDDASAATTTRRHDDEESELCNNFT